MSCWSKKCLVNMDFGERQWLSCLDSQEKFVPLPECQDREQSWCMSSYILRDGGSSRVVLEAQRECGAVWGFDKCLQLGLGWSVFLALYDVGELFSVLSICDNWKRIGLAVKTCGCLCLCFGSYSSGAQIKISVSTFLEDTLVSPGMCYVCKPTTP